jgi:hypothetical protein
MSYASCQKVCFNCMSYASSQTKLSSIQCPCLRAHIYLVVYKTLLLLLLFENIQAFKFKRLPQLSNILSFFFFFFLSRDVNCKTPHLTMTDASGWPELQWRQLNPFRLQTTCCCLHIYFYFF